MSNNYEKFIFHEFLKTNVVNMHDSNNVDHNKEEIINTVVTQHLHSIINDENEQDSTAHVDDIACEETVDIDQVKLDQYNIGFNDAKAQYEPLINTLQEHKQFSELLYQKLEDVSPEFVVDIHWATLTTQLIENIAKKIYLILPVDFEKILKSELLIKVKKFYKKGVIKLTINPEKADLCMKFLELEKLPDKIKHNLEIIKDENCGLNDCKVEWENTCLEYSQEQLAEEIDKILEQLRSKQ